MIVRIQVVKVYDIEVPESELEGVSLDDREDVATSWAYDQRSTWIEEHGTFEDMTTESAEVWEDTILGIEDGCR